MITYMQNIIFFLLILVMVILVYLYITQYFQTKSLRRELDTIFDRIIIMHFDLDGKILDVSDGYSNIFGYDKNSLIGLTIDKGHISPSRTDKPIWSILQDEGAFQGEMELFNTDNKPYWMHKQIVKEYDAYGKHKGYIAISNDITAAKAFEEQQRHLVDQSRHAVMGEMISMIAHQWKQPLATLSAVSTGVHLDIELDQLSSAKLGEDLKTVDGIVEHLSQTIEDFRNFFKNDKKETLVDIKTLIDEALKLIEFKLNHTKVIVNIQERFTMSLLKNELLQVMINLIANAADAMKDERNPQLQIDLETYDNKA